MAIIWSFPGEENARSNPFTATLVAELRKLGHTVASPGWAGRLTGRCDIIHLHWPQKVIQPDLLRSMRSIATWYAFLAAQRARGARIVWTVHNVAGHEKVRPGLERWWMERLLGLVDGIHAMSDTSLGEAIARYPAIGRKPTLVAPHWTYGDAYPQPRRAAGATSGTAPDPAIAFLGDLKAYKGLDRFLDALEAARPDAHRYLVHGRPADGLAPDALAARLEGLRSRGWRLDYVLERLSEQEMADRLDETGLLVLPYHSGENSGLAVLAAERGTPLLVSGLPAFAPLVEELGAPRVTTIAGPLSHRAMAAALDAARDLAGQVPHDFVSRRTPPRVVREISNYYQFLIDSRTASAKGDRVVPYTPRR